MVMLEFCSLEPSAECYDEETYQILENKIQQRIFKCSKIYHPLITHALNMMLEFDHNSRVSPSEFAYQVHSKLRQIKR